MAVNLEVNSLGFGYKDARVLSDITFTLAPGEVLAVIGPNGSGKTTLLKCLTGVLRPTTGSVRINGQPVQRLGGRELSRLLAVVPQGQRSAFPYSVLDMVLMGRTPHLGFISVPGEKDEQLSLAALEEVGVGHLAHRPYLEISGGERQLVLLARALAQQSGALLLDEPTTYLDFRNQLLILQKVRSLAREKQLAVIMNLHDPNHALAYADRALLLHGGRIRGLGPVAEVITAESLHAVYGIEVRIITVDGHSFILPGEIQTPA